MQTTMNFSPLTWVENEGDFDQARAARWANPGVLGTIAQAMPAGEFEVAQIIKTASITSSKGVLLGTLVLKVYTGFKVKRHFRIASEFVRDILGGMNTFFMPPTSLISEGVKVSFDELIEQGRSFLERLIRVAHEQQQATRRGGQKSPKDRKSKEPKLFFAEAEAPKLVTAVKAAPVAELHPTPTAMQASASGHHEGVVQPKGLNPTEVVTGKVIKLQWTEKSPPGREPYQTFVMEVQAGGTIRSFNGIEIKRLTTELGIKLRDVVTVKQLEPEQLGDGKTRNAFHIEKVGSA